MNIVVVDRSCSSSLICDISAEEADFRNCNSACAFEVRDESEHLLLIVNYQYYVLYGVHSLVTGHRNTPTIPTFISPVGDRLLTSLNNTLTHRAWTGSAFNSLFAER